MPMIKLKGRIDDKHHLTAEVPPDIAPGEVEVLLQLPDDEDGSGETWMQGIAREWADELSDSRQDIYTLEDGRPVDESR
jgi:hypothetical protein